MAQTATKMTAKDLRAEIEKGGRWQVIDVRSPQEFEQGHIPCAVNMPMEQMDHRLDDLNPRDPVLLVCRSGMRAEMSAERLRAHRSDVVVLEGGTLAWMEEGYPTVATDGARGIPVVRQAMAAAGVMGLAGAILTLTGQPGWIWLNVLTGVGLTVAGITGWCGMAILLSKMPWNQAKPPKTPSCAT